MGRECYQREQSLGPLAFESLQDTNSMPCLVILAMFWALQAIWSELSLARGLRPNKSFEHGKQPSSSVLLTPEELSLQGLK